MLCQHQKMKVTAAVLHNYKEDLKIEEVNLRDIQPGEVLVKLKASGICHSDLSVKQGALLFPTPIILGHEGMKTCSVFILIITN